MVILKNAEKHEKQKTILRNLRVTWKPLRRRQLQYMQFKQIKEKYTAKLLPILLRDPSLFMAGVGPEEKTFLNKKIFTQPFAKQEYL